MSKFGPEHIFVGFHPTTSDWIGDQFRPGYRGYCIDVGASDGMSVNSTFLLEKMWKWTVLSVEANPYFDDKLKTTRALHRMCAVADKPVQEALFHINLDGLEAFSSLKPVTHDKHAHALQYNWTTTRVPVVTLDMLMEDVKFPRLDALCIDVEGTERDVLSGLDWTRWKPRVLLVEAWDQGSLDDFLEPLGYERVFRAQDNDGYLHGRWGLP